MSARPCGAGEPVGTFNLVECLEPWFDPVPASGNDGAKMRRPTPPETAQASVMVAVGETPKDTDQAPEPPTMEALRKLVQQYGGTVQECLQIGAFLVQFKEAVSHGEFTIRIETLSLNPRTAQHFMMAARRLSPYPRLLKHCFNASMLITLLPLDDVHLHHLERTGCTGGLKLEDMAGMTVRQLRIAVKAVMQGDDPSHAALLAKLRATDTPH